MDIIAAQIIGILTTVVINNVNNIMFMVGAKKDNDVSSLKIKLCKFIINPINNAGHT
ncbi:hypothetical protein D1872_288350 [compost metagenome]